MSVFEFIFIFRIIFQEFVYFSHLNRVGFADFLCFMIWVFVCMAISYALKPWRFKSWHQNSKIDTSVGGFKDSLALGAFKSVPSLYKKSIANPFTEQVTKLKATLLILKMHISDLPNHNLRQRLLHPYEYYKIKQEENQKEMKIIENTFNERKNVLFIIIPIIRII